MIREEIGTRRIISVVASLEQAHTFDQRDHFDGDMIVTFSCCPPETSVNKTRCHYIFVNLISDRY